VFRTHNDSKPLYPNDPRILALAIDAEISTSLPVFALDDFDGVAAFFQARAIALT